MDHMCSFSPHSPTSVWKPARICVSVFWFLSPFSLGCIWGSCKVVQVSSSGHFSCLRFLNSGIANVSHNVGIFVGFRLQNWISRDAVQIWAIKRYSRLSSSFLSIFQHFWEMRPGHGGACHECSYTCMLFTWARASEGSFSGVFWVLERQLSSQELLLLLWKFWVQFPAHR